MGRFDCDTLDHVSIIQDHALRVSPKVAIGIILCLSTRDHVSYHLCGAVVHTHNPPEPNTPLNFKAKFLVHNEWPRSVLDVNSKYPTCPTRSNSEQR